MPAELQVPKLGLTMTEATISQWVKPSGTAVAADEVVAAITTDKLETDIEAGVAGVLHHAAAVGATLPCGAVMAWLLEEGEPAPAAGVAVDVAPVASSAATPISAPAVPRARIVASPRARRAAEQRGLDLARITGSGPGGRITSEDVAAFVDLPAATPQGVPASELGEIRASPLARRVAGRLCIPLEQVPGTGPGGRVLLDDVVQALGPAGPPSAGWEPGDLDPEANRIPLTGMRGTIARRTHASLAEMAQATLGFEVEVARLLELRAAMKAQWSATGEQVPTITDFVLKAVTSALARHPRLNATIEGDSIVVLRPVHIGIAVAVPDGLLVPVVRDADRMSLREMATTTRDLAARARDGSLALAEMEGSTFSVSSLGSFGVGFFTPVVNQPNVAILGVGAIREGVRWEDGVPLPAPRLALSLTIDHRATDGAPAAEFLGAVRDHLEQPLRLLAS